MMFSQKLTLVVIIPVFFISMNCKDEPPVKNNGDTPQHTNPLQLTVEDVTCTEAFLKLSLTTSEQNRAVTLKRSDSTVAIITLTRTDSLIIDEGLLPNKTYTYKLVYGEWDTTAQATTMDTTSHDWSWEITTLGDGGGSTLYDVAIINDTLAYAVGEIHTKDTYTYDSLGNWIDPYNVAKWNGKKWELLRAYFKYNGQDTWSPIHSLFAFRDNDIWFGAGIHWNGEIFETKPLTINFPSDVNKMWGSPNGELYIVGNSGLIASRSISGSWQKIESGTDLNFYSIYGAPDSKTGKLQILAVCSRNIPSGRGIFNISENTATQISTYPINWDIFGIWFVPNRHYYVVGSGIYEKIFLSDSLWKNHPLDITRYGTGSISGGNSNDIFVVGSFGECLHFNGVSWKSYQSNATAINGAYGSVAVKKNLAIAVGFVDNKACITIGKR